MLVNERVRIFREKKSIGKKTTVEPQQKLENERIKKKVPKKMARKTRIETLNPFSSPVGGFVAINKKTLTRFFLV